MKAKFFASAALAILMTQFSRGSVVIVSNKGNTSVENKEVARIDASKLNLKKRQDTRPDFIGNMPMVNIGGDGIPPHIYGQYHVKKGSHKRTNKK